MDSMIYDVDDLTYAYNWRNLYAQYDNWNAAFNMYDVWIDTNLKSGGCRSAYAYTGRAMDYNRLCGGTKFNIAVRLVGRRLVGRRRGGRGKGQGAMSSTASF